MSQIKDEDMPTARAARPRGAAGARTPRWTTTHMIKLLDIRYVRLGTRDRQQADRYASEVLGLQRVRHEARASYFRSDDRDHTLVYFEGDPSDHTIGFELRTADELEAAAAELSNRGVPVRAGTAEECEQRHLRAFIHFQDPTGNKIDLMVGPHHSGRRYFPSRDAGITGFRIAGRGSRASATARRRIASRWRRSRGCARG